MYEIDVLKKGDMPEVHVVYINAEDGKFIVVPDAKPNKGGKAVVGAERLIFASDCRSASSARRRHFLPH